MAGFVGCPVEVCAGREIICTKLLIHFMHHHKQGTIVIIKEGKCTNPHCLACNIFVT